MTTTEYRARLAEDAMKLEASLGAAFDDGCRDRLTPALLYSTPSRGAYDCALDIAIEGRPVAERVQIQRAAKDGGYERPWNRNTGAGGERP